MQDTLTTSRVRIDHTLDIILDDWLDDSRWWRNLLLFHICVIACTKGAL